MDSAEKGKAFEQAIMPGRCSRKCRTSREMNGAKFCPHYVERGAGLSRRLKIRGSTRFMVIGNMTEAQATTLARDVQNSWALMVQSGVETKM